MKIKPIENDILFEFHDHVTSTGFFKEKSKGGIILAQSSLASARDSDHVRIGTVVAIGPKCTGEIQPGMNVLIEPLKWTPQFEADGKTLWKTNERFIVGILDK